ncbi:unnamed protein product [Microthlaspi erraticum]|uniref:Uncharacterized protein n=1 Tax=Microthlaspi erraticum TaxID=1685480 RepID=A0A6D2I3W9_9BRAS|nr:unnamed protein product [Microthlaspi erraticum]CAA7050289.1 unnamed protein product [Microthlaspi erraticum]CAA7052884.1 unnamed protein product [Microthlaspi erraticum]
MEMITPVIIRKAKRSNPMANVFCHAFKVWFKFAIAKRFFGQDSGGATKDCCCCYLLSKTKTLFSGYVTDEEIEKREQELRRSLQNDKIFRVRDGVSVEVAQYNPPFTLPFTRRNRNEVSLEVESKED